MLILIAGLVMFLGIHSSRLLAPQRREDLISRLGANNWKLLYSLVSICGLILTVWGYGSTRIDPVFIYNPPVSARHLALLLTLIAFVLLAASFVPANHLRAKLGHPMFAGIKIWAFSHLLANGRLGDIVLFTAFLLWAVAGFSIRRRQDRRNAVVQTAGTAKGTVITLIAGTAAWGVFAFWLHVWLIGVNPLPF